MPIETKVPKWEAELWDFIGMGNGVTCPIYDTCEVVKRGGWCGADYLPKIVRIHDDDSTDLNGLDFVKPEGRVVAKPYRLVEKLSKKYLEIGRVQSPPVPGALVALFDDTRAVEIREVPLKAYHGGIWRLKDRWIIHINSNDTPEMKRLTLFHEAFHILAHCNSTPVFMKRGFDRARFNEAIADFFACYILMPREWVIEKWAEFKDVDKLAEIFRVPKRAMFFKLRRLGLA